MNNDMRVTLSIDVNTALLRGIVAEEQRNLQRLLNERHNIDQRIEQAYNSYISLHNRLMSLEE